MCLILFAYKKHPKYKLIVAANRDEFYERPTASAYFWEDHPHILAGRDLEKMGTWMGVTSGGRFAALTNYRDPKEITAEKRSRGELVAGYLKGSLQPREYLQEAAKSRIIYPGYNLLAGNTDELYYYSNIEDKIQKVEPGIYGVSNHLLNTDWPKVKRGKEGLSTVMNGESEVNVEQLFALLQNADPAPDEALPSTGVSLEWERILSPMFIKSEGYGTRSSAVLLMTDEEIYYKERVFSKEGNVDQEYKLSF
ncbi:NRDE family protein [Bacillus sp. FJAT-29790]|uniref:NRDE family protein n=1 Tax=Bacillus sp. FJAT-29790 TaxID=1895002 RepID=UPI001C21F988|nr:NRDE family protein [Bacillus sp. FJAT-29790]MBU8880581.1 NRDE family protein [Bacillus sp. FJAT-29790]